MEIGKQVAGLRPRPAGLSALLDDIEHGETIVVTRGGRRIAQITPAPQANGAALREVFARWQGADAFDERFAVAAQVAQAREAVSTEEDTHPWRD